MYYFDTMIFGKSPEILQESLLISKSQPNQMDKRLIQIRLLEQLASSNPPKWNACHTEEKNLFKRFPTHMRGTKEVKKALEELYRMEFINRYIKTGEAHVSLNIRKKKEIEEFLES